LDWFKGLLIGLGIIIGLGIFPYSFQGRITFFFGGRRPFFNPKLGNLGWDIWV